MADIKQAAKWMELGNKVRRADWVSRCPSWIYDIAENEVRYDRKTDFSFLQLDDLLADDWEIDEGGPNGN